uniref:Ammonium transporter AmtB-like domain-containing protein n=1 Tax=Daphnia galeata TaxID=27404 RepID=A0A8J2WFQ5_9CRUS|nr:unnamed protein product [Daphnia galeata]
MSTFYFSSSWAAFVFCIIIHSQDSLFMSRESFVKKNVVSVAFRNIINTTISSLTYFLTGFALSFGEGNVASCVPSGVVHERSSTVSFVSYTALTSGFIYPVAAHWVATNNGWLHQLGFDDFAFSGVVHAMSGATCLIAAYMTGPRLDRSFERT